MLIHLCRFPSEAASMRTIPFSFWIRWLKSSQFHRDPVGTDSCMVRIQHP